MTLVPDTDVTGSRVVGKDVELESFKLGNNQ